MNEDDQLAEQVVAAVKLKLAFVARTFEVRTGKRVLGSGATVSAAVCAALAGGSEPAREHAWALHLAAALAENAEGVEEVAAQLFEDDEDDEDEEDEEEDDEPVEMRRRG